MKESGEKKKRRYSDSTQKHKKVQSESRKKTNSKSRTKEAEFIQNNYPLIEYLILYLNNPKAWFRLFRRSFRKEIRDRSKNLFYLILFFAFALTMLLTSFFLTIMGLVYWIKDNTNNPHYIILILAVGLFLAAMFLFFLMKIRFKRFLRKSLGDNNLDNY